VDDIENLGHDVWFDQELTGGHAWWDQVLERIRECDLFIFALAREALDSYACKLEYTYAFNLSKTILPILMTDGVSTNLLPPALSKIQYVDYRSQDKQSAFSLFKALSNLPAPQPLPEPLPEPPEVPISYLGDLKEQIETKATLSFQDQTALLIKLKERLNYNNEVDDVLNLLRQLGQRDDLFAKVAKEIDRLTASSSAQKTEDRQSPSTNFESSQEGTELTLQTSISEETDGQKEWSAELISQGDRERIIRVRLSKDVHIIKYRLIVKQLSQNEDIVEVDGVVVAQGRSLFSAGGVFNFPVNDGTRQYAATVDVRTLWTDLKIHSFRLNIGDHILYSEGIS